MTPIVFDCECFYDPPSGYTLSKMTTESFVRDPRFSLHGAAIKWAPEQKAVWYPTRQLVEVMSQVDWTKIGCISHHAHWDHFVLNHHFGIRPAYSLCTLSMARLMLGNHISVSLDNVRAHFGIPPKTTPYNLFVGKHWDEMGAETQRLLGEGACDEAESKWIIFQKMLADGFPPSEFEVIDQTVKAFSQPQLLGDTVKLGEVWTHEFERKKELLRELAVTPGDLQSADKFVELLEREGVEVETKAGKVKPIPAIAKTDEFMKSLLEDDNERVRCLAEARLGVRSTLDQTRAERLGFMATRGAMPVYLSYAGAHTTRWSGGDKCLVGDSQIAVAGPKGICYKRLDTLQPDEMVWDGLEFVNHEGLVFQGERETVEWEGIVATPDHVCWEEAGTAITIGAAKAAGVRIMGAALPRHADWVLACNRPDRSATAFKGVMSLPMPAGVTSQHQQYSDREKHALQALLRPFSAHEAAKQKSWEPVEQHTATLHQPETSSLASLRGAGNQEQIQDTPGVHSVCLENFSGSGLPKLGSGSPRQQRPLRAEQHTPGNTVGAVPEHRTIQSTQRVYDIKNCGPRRRFMANGKLVHNCNWQNLKRGSHIRKAVGAPAGYRIVKADKSQIECRILNFLAEQWDVIERFADGTDPYTGIASRFYGREITKNDPAERGVGKQLELSCGYGAGAETIVRTARRGTYGPPVQLTSDQGLAARDLYRSTHPGVVAYWKQASRMIAAIAGTSQAIQWGPMTVDTGVIWGPGNVPIWYPELHYEDGPDGGQWVYKTRKGFTKLYGGKLTENVIQFLSRLDMSGSLHRIYARTKIRWAHLEHDAATWVVPVDLVDPFVKIVEIEMTRAPEWLGGCPLACEISVGETM